MNARFVKIEDEMYELLAGEVYSQINCLIFKKILRQVRMYENKKKQQPVLIFLVEVWSIAGHVTKVVEWIVKDFGLLILQKQKY